ncbi:uncharacterized protein BJ212DRAFT_1482413 [Suillus subaureus]|uniref:Uncharacterized protein n=1 Tax=Suillus subaureus TaxID=48587 RepID=A0A9P7E7F6_9AGAM|nr:uncharacterized protein BJ212DRAFT_1482413 [Suillus subaureus]KAG1813501.1 hypothetical protein BJ212DRAFT_1482413 [Suillus subaureus]
MAAGIWPPHVPHIPVPNEPVQPRPPAPPVLPVPPMPPVYGPIHYEGAIDPHNFNNPLHYFASNPALPLHAPPEPDYYQFNIQFQHHFQEEQMENEQIRNDLLHRQAQEAFRQEQLQQQLQQQEARRINREVEEALHLQQQQAEQWQMQQQMQQQFWQQEAQQVNRQAQHALELEQHEAEQMNRQHQGVLQVGQHEEQRHNRQEQRVHEQEEHLEEALHEYNDPVSQENCEQDEERRRTQEHEHCLQHGEEEQHINQAVPVPDGGRPYTEPITHHTLGPLNIECTNCHAMHFACEKLSNSSQRNPRFGMCCLQGQVNFPPFPAWPPELRQAYTDRTFISKIHQYNSALAFISVGVNIEDHALQGSGPNAFHIHRSLHHLMGSLIPPEGLQPSYAQLYIYDPEEATNICATCPGNEGLDRHILRELHDMLY